jgi:hypothetical protein
MLILKFRGQQPAPSLAHLNDLQKQTLSGKLSLLFQEALGMHISRATKMTHAALANNLVCALEGLIEMDALWCRQKAHPSRRLFPVVQFVSNRSAIATHAVLETTALTLYCLTRKPSPASRRSSTRLLAHFVYSHSSWSPVHLPNRFHVFLSDPCSSGVRSSSSRGVQSWGITATTASCDVDLRNDECPPSQIHKKRAAALTVGSNNCATEYVCKSSFRPAVPRVCNT